MRLSILKGTLWVLLGTAVLMFVACGSDNSTSTGTLQVALTDAVDPSLKEVVISIKEIRAVPNGNENQGDSGLPLIKTFAPSLVVNVLDLAYQQEILGEALVPTGTYNQIRLILDANSDGDSPVNYITFQDDSVVALDSDELALKIPSAQTSGLKILGKFTVLPGEITAIVLDFDPAKAIHESSTDKWILKPTGIRIVEVEDLLPQYGAITGIVLSSGLVVENAIVSVVPEGQERPSASGLVNPEDGSFRALLPEGAYFIMIDAEGFDSPSSEPELFDVVVGEDTDAGVVDLTDIQPL